MPFAVSSPAFANGQAIPPAFTCDGTNISPPLAWHDAPPGTRSFVLVVEDPDAPSGTFYHWGIHDIPAAQMALAAGAPLGRQSLAINDFGEARYGGPCPPPGDPPHHYHFRLAALSRATLPLARNADIVALWRAAEPYIIARVEMIGTYSRRLVLNR